jgi:hypothetical protein
MAQRKYKGKCPEDAMKICFEHLANQGKIIFKSIVICLRTLSSE